MELKEIRTFRNGLEKWDYDTIEIVLNDYPEMNNAWCDCCGITNDDKRRIYGWPKHFEKFYAGYAAAKRQIATTIGKEVFIVVKIKEGFECDIKDNEIVFNEYRNAIAYINSLPEEHNVGYDIDDIKMGD